MIGARELIDPLGGARGHDVDAHEAAPFVAVDREAGRESAAGVPCEVHAPRAGDHSGELARLSRAGIGSRESDAREEEIELAGRRGPPRRRIDQRQVRRTGHPGDERRAVGQDRDALLGLAQASAEVRGAREPEVRGIERGDVRIF